MNTTGKRIIKLIKWALPLGLVVLGFAMYVYLYFPLGESAPGEPVYGADIARAWRVMSGGMQGKVVFARPPGMYIFDLGTGEERLIPGVETAGSRGRRLRGHSPRPSWSPKGDRFLYRYQGEVYVCNLQGEKKIIGNPLMDCSHETRWSWWHGDGGDWAIGPSLKKNAIMVNLSTPDIFKTIYGGGDVKEHCELTGTGHYLVYFDGTHIYSLPNGTMVRDDKFKISQGQSCRPCAAPDDRVAWLPFPHDRYWIYDAATGKKLAALRAPEGEEIYRLNWSNHPDYAVHMYGSQGNERMHLRKVSTGESIYIGCGWDPDLWVELK